MFLHLPITQMKQDLFLARLARVQIVHGSVIMEDGDTLLQENNTITEIEFFRLVQEDGEDLFFESGNACVLYGWYKHRGSSWR